MAADGASADLVVPWAQLPHPDDPDPDPDVAAAGVEAEVAALAALAAVPRTAVLLLVRRGGYAVGTARDGRLTDHATGTRYVQARTAAGGWSQQRYARRRTGQAAVLVTAAAGALRRVLDRAAAPAQVLVPGGDRALVTAVLDDQALGVVRALPRGPLLDVADPRLDVLAAAAERARAVRVTVRQR